MKWLITGGAGYIGSHVVDEFMNHGEEVVVLDSLVLGKKDRIQSGIVLAVGDIGDSDFVSGLINKHRIKGVINLAALKSVDESERFPEKYEKVNHQSVETLLQASVSNGVEVFLQSSTAAVYGNGNNGYASEDDPLSPISPYGSTKFSAESVLNKSVMAGLIRGTSLRYFNVAGSQSKKLKDTSTANLIPKVLRAIADGVPPIIYGNDYPTPDGTCIRDYVHVQDVARAHLLAASALQKRQIAPAINIGTGEGYSVIQMMNAILTEHNSRIVPCVEPRRQGDPAMLVAKIELAKTEIGFTSEKTLEDMVSTSYL